MYKNILKPIFDFLAIVIGLVIVAPIYIVVAILLSVANQRKPFSSKIPSSPKHW